MGEWSNDMDAAPHETLVLLYWKRWDDSEYMEAGYASTGKRFPNGYSTMSFHADATHWMHLPAPPQAESAADKAADSPVHNTGDKHASA